MRLAAALLLVAALASSAARAGDTDTFTRGDFNSTLDAAIDKTRIDMNSPANGWQTGPDVVGPSQSYDDVQRAADMAAFLGEPFVLNDAEKEKVRWLSLLGIGSAFSDHGQFGWGLLEPYYALELMTGIDGPVHQFLSKNPQFAPGIATPLPSYAPFQSYLSESFRIRRYVLELSALCTADPADFPALAARAGLPRPQLDDAAIGKYLETEFAHGLSERAARARTKFLFGELKRIGRECWKG